MNFTAAPGRESLAFHASSPDGRAGYVLLLEGAEGSAKGRVRVRRWEAPDYTAPPAESAVEAALVRSDVEQQSLAGWRFTLPPARIFAWLEEAVGHAGRDGAGSAW